MKVTKITEAQYDLKTNVKVKADENVIRQYATKAAPPNLMKGISIVAEYILELPYEFMELIVEVLTKQNKRYILYPKPDNVVIAVQY